MSRATCRSCGAPIEWARFAVSGKPVPLDVGLVDDGNLELVERGPDVLPLVRMVPYRERELRRELGVPLRRTHFASCPNAAAHRRARA